MSGYNPAAFGVATDMAFSMPMDASNPHTLDHDALLEALAFMDDLDLDSAEFAMPVKLETPGATDQLVPADAYTLGAFMAESQNKPQHTPAASPASRSPPASVVSSASPPVSPSTVSTTSSTAKPKGVVNRSRNRRREELQYLRSLVGELEDRLTTLRKRADEQQQQEQVKQSGDEPVADDPVLTAVWEDLATRQYAQRQRAEVENNKLRRMLEDQIQVGKSLERLLKRRSNTDDLDVPLDVKRARRSSLSTAWNNAAIFDELLAHLQPMYEELASVFSKVNFERDAPNFRDVQVHNDAEMGVKLDVTEAHIFPFDYALTSQEFWTLFGRETENDRFHYHDMDIDNHTLKAQFGMTVQVARMRGDLNMKIVSRRYVEATRTVVVWAGFCDPTEISDTSMEGIYMRYKGWNIVEPLAPTSSSANVGTRITSYCYAVPEAFEDVPDQKRKVGTLTNFMLGTVDVQISARQQQLENRLVELSRAGSR